MVCLYDATSTYTLNSGIKLADRWLLLLYNMLMNRALSPLSLSASPSLSLSPSPTACSPFSPPYAVLIQPLGA